MRKFFVIFLLSAFFSLDSSAQIARSTSFDNRPACEQSRGVWRQYGNGCVDECNPKFEQFAICTRAVTFGCDCGKNRCWNGETCVTLKDYKKIFDVEKAEEQKILNAAKEKRKEDALENQEEIMSRLITIADEKSSQPQVDANGKPIAPNNNFVEVIKGINGGELPIEQQSQPQGQAITAATSVPVGGLETIQPRKVAPEIVINPDPQVPALFLQQEKAKQEAEKKAQQSAQASDAAAQKTTQGTATTTTQIPAVPGLPVIPLPSN